MRITNTRWRLVRRNYRNMGAKLSRPRSPAMAKGALAAASDCADQMRCRSARSVSGGIGLRAAIWISGRQGRRSAGLGDFTRLRVFNLVARMPGVVYLYAAFQLTALVCERGDARLLHRNSAAHQDWQRQAPVNPQQLEKLRQDFERAEIVPWRDAGGRLGNLGAPANLGPRLPIDIIPRGREET